MDGDNSGFTILELLIGLSVFVVAGGMILTLLTSASGMYRNAAQNARLQSESRRAEARLREAVMDASVLYAENGEKELLFFAGEAEEEGGMKTYAGTVFLWNGETETLYGTELIIRDSVGDGKFPGGRVRDWIADSDNLSNGEVLSDNVEDFKLEFYGTENASPSQADSDRQKMRDGKRITVCYFLKFSFETGSDWEISSCVTTRNTAIQIGMEDKKKSCALLLREAVCTQDFI